MIPIAKPLLDNEEAQAAYDTILSGWITQGPRIKEFEERFAAYVDAPYAVAVSNCTTALHLCMIVSGIGQGDEVICPSMTYIATANAIRYVGATPVFAEVERAGFNLDPADVESRITAKTKAILLVHQIGMPADIDVFMDLCNRRNLLLIEDAACAIGSAYKGQKIGVHSALVCFSFHPRKVITTGDGGMITTNNPAYYNRLQLLRQHGMSVNDRVRHLATTLVFEEHLELGYNYRMTDIQAAVGIKQLSRLDEIVAMRRKLANDYNEAFSDLDDLILPTEKPGYFSNYQSYCIYLKDSASVSRNDLMLQLLERGISTRRGIMNIHRESAYRSDYKDLYLPVSEDLQDHSLLLPLYVPMKNEDFLHIVRSVRGILTAADRITLADDSRLQPESIIQ
jgi:perosamine synthetase